MQKHTKIYMKHFGYAEQDFIKCEVEGCYKKAVDIHHIEARQMGGTSIDKNNIENLCAICREHHDKAGGDIEFNKKVKRDHLKWLKIFATFGKT